MAPPSRRPAKRAASRTGAAKSKAPAAAPRRAAAPKKAGAVKAPAPTARQKPATAKKAAPTRAMAPTTRELKPRPLNIGPDFPMEEPYEAEPVELGPGGLPPGGALPSGEGPSGERRGLGGILPVELEPQRVEEALTKLGEELKHWANKGRYTRVRFKFRGKQLLPDLPLAAVVAAEGLTFYWGGILRVLLMNVAGGSLLSVELVNDSEKSVQAGREALLAGDLDAALGHFRTALEMDRDSAAASLNLGVALKLRGDQEGARAALERARALDPEGPVGREAERVLASLSPRA